MTTKDCIDYTVLTSYEKSKLIMEVYGQIQLGEGWEPLGGVAVEVDLDGAGSTFHQAMARYTYANTAMVKP